MSSEKIEREAAEWFAHLRVPEGEGQREAFARWCAADPRHAEAYAQYEKLWTAAGKLRRPPEARPAPRMQLGWPALVAASAALILMVAIGTEWFGPQSAVSGPPLVAFEATTAKALRLDDGSVVLLAPGATVSSDYSAKARDVHLASGEARFVVVHGDARPFRVLAGASAVLATGTVFDVRLAGGGTEVALIEGRVEVRTRQGSPVRLTAGEGVGADGARRPSPIPQRWTPPRVSVEAMALRDVLALANRDSANPIALADPELGDRLVTGTFDLADTRALARKLAAALGLLLDESGGRLVLSRPR